MALKEGGENDKWSCSMILGSLIGKQTNKDSLAAELVCGSNAAGEALPPHFQFQTKDTTDDGKRLQNDSSIVNKWLGYLERTAKGGGVLHMVWTQMGRCTIASLSSICSTQSSPFIHTHATGQGRGFFSSAIVVRGDCRSSCYTSWDILAYLYLCVPNTTAVMPETDQTYGGFKSQYRHNLMLHVVCDKLVLLEKCVSVFQCKHGLLVFGSIDEDTRLELESAFELGFLHEWCLDSWKQWCCPLNRKCHDEPQVRKSIDMEEEYARLLVNSVQEANEYVSYALTNDGNLIFDAAVLGSHLTGGM